MIALISAKDMIANNEMKAFLEDNLL